MFKHHIKLLFSLFALSLFVLSCEQEEPLQAIDSSATELTSLDLAPSDNLLLTGKVGVGEDEIAASLGLEAGGTFAKSRNGFTRPQVYTQTNAAAGNEIVLFTTNTDGTVTESGRFATEGLGTDDNLANQGALALSGNGKFLYAVNAGSNDLTVFYVFDDGNLRFLDRIDSGGERPVSVAVYKNLVYVVNAATTNVAGFYLNRSGRLNAISGSPRSLSADNAVASQIGFKPNGRALVVTERATNALSSWEVLSDGTLGSANVLPSAGATPFGFDFSRNGRFIVSEAAGGAPGASTVSTYRLLNDGSTELVNGPLALNSSAACWIAHDPRTGYTYSTNTSDATISNLIASANGDLAFAASGNDATADQSPHDIELDGRARYAYVLDIGSDALITYSIASGGALTRIDSDAVAGSTFASGIVVR